MCRWRLCWRGGFIVSQVLRPCGRQGSASYDMPPSHDTISRFRRKLAGEGLWDELLETLNRQLAEHHILINETTGFKGHQVAIWFAGCLRNGGNQKSLWNRRSRQSINALMENQDSFIPASKLLKTHSVKATPKPIKTMRQTARISGKKHTLTLKPTKKMCEACRAIVSLRYLYSA